MKGMIPTSRRLSTDELKNQSPRCATPWMLLVGGFVFGLFFVINTTSTGQSGELIQVTPTAILQAIPFMLLLYAVGIALVMVFSKAPNPAAFFTLFFVLRIGVAIILGWSFQFDDEVGFHIAGDELPYGLWSWDMGRGYYYLVGALYAVFGSNLLLPKVVNAFVGSLMAFTAYGVAQYVFAKSYVARRVFLLAGLVPTAIVFSAVNLKEIQTAFLLMLVSWFLAAQRHGIGVRVAGNLMALGVLYWLRGPVWATVGAVGTFAYLLLAAYRGSSVARRRSVARGCAVGACLVLVIVTLRPVVVEPVAEMVTNRLTAEQYFVNRFEASEATVMQFVDVEQPLSPRTLLILFVRGLYAPSPLRVFQDFQVGKFIEAITIATWYFVFPLAVIGAWVERRSPAVTALWVMLVVVLVIATMGETVGADSYRHKMVGVGLVCVLAGYGWNKELWRSHPWPLRLWWIGAALFSGAMFTLQA